MFANRLIEENKEKVKKLVLDELLTDDGWRRAMAEILADEIAEVQREKSR